MPIELKLMGTGLCILCAGYFMYTTSDSWRWSERLMRLGVGIMLASGLAAIWRI